MSRLRRAFSLTELLVVIAIVIVLAGLLFPVLARAKAGAKVETSKSYLRQEYLALELYAQGADGRLPSWRTVQETSSMHAPCSPLDSWRKPCWNRKSPMLGSYGYVVPLNDELTHPVVAMSGARPLLADAFSSDYRPGEFEGPRFPSYTSCSLAGTCEVPERVWFVYTDGGLRVMKRAPVTPSSRFDGKPRMVFSWPGLFERQSLKDDRQGDAGG